MTLTEILIAVGGWQSAYQKLCNYLRKRPDPSVWSDSYSKQSSEQLLESLEWYEIFDLLELNGAKHVAQINAAFERSGLAYVAARHQREVRIDVFDPEGLDLEIAGDEDEVVEELVGKFGAASTQYQKAIDMLRGRPADYEKAVSEAVGALEGVARVLGGKKDFGSNIDKLFDRALPWEKSLSTSIKALYGCASNTPGVRHGRYTDPMLDHEDALLTVRTAGALIAYLTSRDRIGSW